MENQSVNQILREDLIKNDDLREQSDELLEKLLANVNDANISNPDAEDLQDTFEILSSIAYSRAKQGFSPRETSLFIFSLKAAMIKVLQHELKADAEGLLDASLRVNTLMDNLAIITFETYIKGREEVILKQTDEISEISTPVIRVWDGILAIPLIGTLDSARTQVVMENLLEAIVETGSSIAILDISGVPAVDSLVAQHLIKTVSATRLMGGDCIISGIRPEIAQTIVHLGIDLSTIVTKATLANALSYAFGVLRIETRKVQKS